MIRSSYAFAATALLWMTACAGAEDRRAAADSTRATANGGATAHTTELTALPVIDHVELMAREPMLVQARDGALYVSGYGEDHPLLWRSSDNGAHWERVNVGTPANGAVGNSDVDLAIGPDGTLYFVAMTYDRAKFEGRGIAVGSSRDDGASWTWTSLSRDRYDDRPWIEVAPNGVAHAIWNDGSGVSHAVSTDRGLTWTERTRIHPKGGSSHIAIAPTGTIAVRIVPLSASANKFDAGVDSLAVSTDGGLSWSKRGLPGSRIWSAFDENAPMQRWVEPLSWDERGALYSLWSEGTSMWIARSADNGASWTKRRIAHDSTELYFPYLTARGNGELGMTWFSGLGDAVRANLAHLEYDVRAADSVATPRVHRFDFPSFARGDTTTGPARRRDTAGEYIPIIFLRDGRVATV
ncbi:MAG: sialidase family protein, partial [Gemmatimonas sp.]